MEKPDHWLCIAKGHKNTWEGVHHYEQIYRNQITGHEISKSIKTHGKEFTIMNENILIMYHQILWKTHWKEFIIIYKHIETRSLTLQCESPYKTPGKEFIIMNENIETRSLVMYCHSDVSRDFLGIPFS